MRKLGITLIVIILVILSIYLIRSVFNDFSIGKMSLKYSDYLQAIKRLTKVIEKEPNNLLAHIYLGLALGKKGDFENALREFNWVKQRQPNILLSAEVHNQIGMIYYLKEMYPEAIEEFKKAVLLKPRLADTYFNLGTAYSAWGDIHNAVSAYSMVVKLNPRHVYGHWNLAINLEKMGDLEGAIRHWEKYIEFTPGVFRHPEVENHILELKKQIKKGEEK